MQRVTTCALAVLPVIATAGIASAAKLTYEPLSEEAANLGRLDKYDRIKKRDVTLTLGDLRLEARVPARGEAYDTIPIRYRLDGKTGDNDRVAIEAVAFEDESRRKGRDLYDLAMPGTMKLQIEYLGSQTGVYIPKRATRLTAKSRHIRFPPYGLRPFVRSGTVERGNYLFFKFRITNVGDTILDPEGFGGWMAIPEAKQEDGDYRTGTINQYPRHVEYVYPGESFEQWVHFHGKGQHARHARTLPLGKFKVRYRAAYRQNTEYDWIANMWAGPVWTGLEVDIQVADKPARTPVETRPLEFQPASTDRMCRYVRSLEEFMTSFRVFERDELTEARTGTIHIQIAPWTEQIVLKLIGNKPGEIATAAVPVTVDTHNLAITPNPDNPFVVIKRDGSREPAFLTQNMAAMRATTQLGPKPEKHMRQRLEEMMDCGVNVLCTTAGNWHQAQIYDPNAFVGDIHAETFKHYYDAITPRYRIPVFGWGVFPPKTHSVLGTGSHYWKQKFDVPFIGNHYNYSHSSQGDLDVAHPDFPKLYAGAILFNYQRWGRQWYRTADGDMLIDVEDTWGWLRDDINVRYMLGKHAIDRWHAWLAEKYGSIDAVNRAWGTDFARIEDIDPQANQGDEGKAYHIDLSHIKPVYTNPDNPFHDWTPAIDDWDRFRTHLRCDVYEAITEEVRKVIPRACINLRTEGGFIPVSIPADIDVAHLRHSRYCQRRQALVSDVLQERKVFKYHSDYTTIPYTESEWRILLRQLREEGIRGNYLPQFCTARDMVLNDDYGRDFTINYNLDKPQRAVMMHVLQAAYPVWRIMYEEGHCPGVLWEDYNCDGFVSETQKRELRLFREKLDAIARDGEKER